MSPEKKKKVNRGILAFGILVVAIAFFSGWLAYQWGIVIFVFCLVAMGIIKIVVPEPEPEPEEPLPAGESYVDKVMKTAESGEQDETKESSE